MFRTLDAQRIVPVACAFLLGLSPLTSRASDRIEVTFEVLVDSNMTIPGSSETFSRLYTPALDAGNVAFTGLDQSGRIGIYRRDSGGPLELVADTSTVVPGVRNFLFLGNPSIQGPLTSFGTNRGIFSASGGILTPIATTNDLVPDQVNRRGDPVHFSAFTRASLDAPDVAFDGGWGILSGVYIADGSTFVKVADRETVIPGHQVTFKTLGYPVLEEGEVAFWGEGRLTGQGIYHFSRGSLRLVADENTPPPEGFGAFREFHRTPVLADGTIAFMAEKNGTGIYRDKGEGLEVVVRLDTPVPDSNEPFAGFSPYFSMDEGNVVFQRRAGFEFGFDSGIYLENHGTIYKIIEDTDLLEGEIPFLLGVGREALSDNQIAFWARMAPSGRDALFLATFEILDDLEASIDVVPRLERNFVFPLSRAPIPVALLGSEELDVSEVDIETLAFGPSGALSIGERPPRDIDDDGFDDLVSRYRTDETGIAFGDTEACLSGETFDGHVFEGCDVIETCGRDFELALLVPTILFMRGRFRGRRVSPGPGSPGRRAVPE